MGVQASRIPPAVEGDESADGGDAGLLGAVSEVLEPHDSADFIEQLNVVAGLVGMGYNAGEAMKAGGFVYGSLFDAMRAS